MNSVRLLITIFSCLLGLFFFYGQKSQCVPDTDGDGIADYTDNCPQIVNPMQLDSDSDGKGDICDALPSCKSILETYNLETQTIPNSGVYTIDPDGDGGALPQLQVYCDMVTDGGGWTQIEYLTNDAEGYNEKYAAVFSNDTVGTLGFGSYKIASSNLLANALYIRYSENSPTYTDSRTYNWTYDFKCEATSLVKEKIQNPGTQNQAPASIKCTNIKTGQLSTRAIYINYQYWGGGWNVYYPRIWIGSSASAPSYHGDYVVDGVVTWKYGNSTLGVYSPPSSSTGNAGGSTAFWVR